jgi:plasmid segregation protein ParM
MNVIGLDVGRNGVKVYANGSMFTFASVVGEGRERKLRTDYADRGFEVRFNGEYYFVGELAQNESDYKRSMMTDSKAHTDTLILALTAIHRVGLSEVTVVTGLPVNQHDDTHKAEIRRLLIGSWDVTVDGQRRNIRIVDVKVAVEGGAAFWSSPQDGVVRVIDAGSKTVNYVTMKNRRYIDLESGTLPFGFGTGKTENVAQMAKRIAGELGRKWEAGDNVLVCGGRAKELAELITPYFPMAAAMPNALYANAIGFYRAGVNTL